jgi:hypothetical protein
MKTLKANFVGLQKGTPFIVVNQSTELPELPNELCLLCVEAKLHGEDGNLGVAVKQYWIPATFLD